MSTHAMIQFLRASGAAELMHDSHVPFLEHLTGTRRILQQWGVRQALSDAGLFHSVYGTEFFALDESVEAPARTDVQELIGADAEEVAWLWCTIERFSLDPSSGVATNRVSGAPMTLAPNRVQDIANLWAADTVEQLARMTPDERGFARGAVRLADQMLPVARDALEETLARTPCDA